MKLRLLIVFGFVATALVLFYRSEIRSRATYEWNRVTGREFTVSDRLKQFGELARTRRAQLPAVPRQ